MILTCANCNKEIERSLGSLSQVKNNRVFCSKSCAAQINNKLFPKRKSNYKCSVCGIKVGRKYERCDSHKIKYKINAVKIKYSDRSLGYRIACNIRSRLNAAIKNKSKTGSAVKDLGRSIEEFIKYIESKFEIGMSWNNWGLKGWHIDHIIPLSKFNLNNRQEFLKACHYTNMQPLWAKENLKKADIMHVNVEKYNPEIIDFSVKEEEIKEKIIELYRSRELTINKVANIVGCSANHVIVIARKLGLKKERYLGKLYVCKHCKTDDIEKFNKSKIICDTCKINMKRKRDLNRYYKKKFLLVKSELFEDTIGLLTST